MFGRSGFAAVMAALMAGAPCPGMTLKEFRKFSTDEQGTYVGAAIGMLAYSYAANGNVAKASCIKNYFFGKKGENAPGPREISIEIGVAAKLDPEKQVEGVIMGTADRVCGSDPTPPAGSKP